MSYSDLLLYKRYHNISTISLQGCNKYGNLCRSPSSGLSAQGKTRLDRERAKMCQAEMVSYLLPFYVHVHTTLSLQWQSIRIFHYASEFLGLLDSPCNNGANGDYT